MQPPGTRYFRQTISVPAQRKIKQAYFLLTADNSFELYVNGKEAGTGEDQRTAKKVNITKCLRAGRNVLAIAATNGWDRPNPAGLIGRFWIDFDQGPPLSGRIDKTWKTSQREADGWTGPTFGDSDLAVGS